MEKFVSSWADGKTLPKKYVFPPEERPGDYIVTSDKIPIIDMGNDRSKVIQQIMQASQDELGAFQVINHGVPRTLMDDARQVFKEFFELEADEKSRFCSNPKCKLYTSNSTYDEEEVHLWRDALKTRCTFPLEECMPYWPQKPTRYRVVAAEYIMKVKELASTILEMMGQGLGLEEGYFGNEKCEKPELTVNRYPPCPDPTVTFGASRHGDPTFITVLMQDEGVPGLQLYKDGEWLGVQPIPDAFVVNLGFLMQMATNGKLRWAEHRVITNATEVRQSVAFFICPTLDCVIEPAKALINAQNPAMYKSLKFGEFAKIFAAGRLTKNFEDLLKPFRLEA